MMLLRLLPFLVMSSAFGARFVDAPQVKANPNPAVPLAAVVTFTADAPVRTSIVVSDGRHSWTLDYGLERDPAKGLPVVGMRPNRKHTLDVTIRDESGTGTKAKQTLQFTTPALPLLGEEFPPYKVTVRKPKKMEPGYTIFSPRRSKAGDLKFGAQFGMLLAIDSEGEPVWYFRANSRISDLERRKNGNFLFITQDYRLTEIDMLGNVVAEWYAKDRPQGPARNAIPVDTLTFHHEVDELPDGSLVVLGSEIREIDNYYTSEWDKNAPRQKQRVMGDEVVVFDRAGKVLWKWKAFDHMDPFRLGYETFDGYWDRRGFPGVVDWSHGNGLLYDESDDSLLVCFRYQAAIVKLDRKTGEVWWVLGDPQGWPEKLQDKLFRLEGADHWFYHQHAPYPSPNGGLMLFNNDNYRARPFDPPVPLKSTHSHAVEYRLDEKDRVARLVWKSEALGQDSVISTAMGDVDWMPKTGNVLVHYGALLPKGDMDEVSWDNMQQFAAWSRIREYTHSKNPELVWEAVLGDPSGKAEVGWVLFGGDRVSSLMPGSAGK